jgi:hypothetical protein
MHTTIVFIVFLLCFTNLYLISCSNSPILNQIQSNSNFHANNNKFTNNAQRHSQPSDIDTAVEPTLLISPKKFLGGMGNFNFLILAQSSLFDIFVVE